MGAGLKKGLVNRIIGIGMAAVMTLCAAACGNDAPKKDEPAAQSSSTESDSGAEKDSEGNLGALGKKDQDKKNEDNKPEESEEQLQDITISFSTEDDIKKFLAGEWKYIFPKTGYEYATVIFEEDGTLTLIRDYDGTSCKGKISFSTNNSDSPSPDAFSIELKNIQNFLPESKREPVTMDTETSGDFYIGTGAGQDYLYLEEIGNGDTWVSYCMLNPYYGENEFNFQTQWIFTRKNDRKDTMPPAKDADFYGFAWQSDDDGLFVQKMIPVETEEYDEYSDRHFTGAQFRMSDDAGVRYYSYSADLDFSRCLYEKKLNSKYPFGIYGIVTDENGDISGLNEVDMALYGIYDMQDLEPKFSVSDDGKVFNYNNGSYKLEDFGSAANAIMDCVKVGNWIILDCHVSPHIGQYLFFNTISGWVELTIDGSNLVWKNDDLSTAVYSSFNEVHDIWGNLIGGVPSGGEIYNLKLDGDNIEAEYMVIEDKTEKDSVERFEYEPVDGEMFRYFEYLISRRNREWNSFIDSAPEGGAAFIMVNPPSCISNHIPYIRTYVKDALDTVAIVSMQDQEKIFLGKTGTLYSDSGAAFYETAKAELNAFTVTVPEGMATEDLVVRTVAGREDITWPVEQISGRTPQRSIFLTSSESKNRSHGENTAETDPDEKIAYSYQNHPYRYIDGDRVFATGNLYTITLDEKYREKLPNLEKALERFADTREAYILDFFSDSQKEIREMFESGWGLAYESDQSFYPIRADGRVFSFTVVNYTYLAGAHGVGAFVGYSFDPVLGRQISFSDVVKRTDNLPEIIVDELEKQNTDLKKYFEGCPGDRESLLKDIPRRLANDAEYLAWAIDYDGIIVYFEDYAMGSYAVGMQEVKIGFEDYPDIFTDTYNNYSKASVPRIESMAKKDKEAPMTQIAAVNPEELWDYGESEGDN